MTGSAVTAWCEPGDYGPVHHAISVAGAGDVIVVAAGGRRDIAVIGELLRWCRRRKGIAGVVVDGGVRDVATVQGADPTSTCSPSDHLAWFHDDGARQVNEPIVFGGVPSRRRSCHR